MSGAENGGMDLTRIFQLAAETLAEQQGDQRRAVVVLAERLCQDGDLLASCFMGVLSMGLMEILRIIGNAKPTEQQPAEEPSANDLTKGLKEAMIRPKESESER